MKRVLFETLMYLQGGTEVKPSIEEEPTADIAPSGEGSLGNVEVAWGFSRLRGADDGAVCSRGVSEPHASKVSFLRE